MSKITASWSLRPGAILKCCIQLGCVSKQRSSVLSPPVGSLIICSSRKSWAKVISDSGKIIDRYEQVKLHEGQSIPGRNVKIIPKHWVTGVVSAEHFLIGPRGCLAHLNCGEICNRAVKVLTKNQVYIAALHRSSSCEYYR